MSNSVKGKPMSKERKTDASVGKPMPKERKAEQVRIRVRICVLLSRLQLPTNRLRRVGGRLNPSSTGGRTRMMPYTVLDGPIQRNRPEQLDAQTVRLGVPPRRKTNLQPSFDQAAGAVIKRNEWALKLDAHAGIQDSDLRSRIPPACN
jgi:hypothetical protein